MVVGAGLRAVVVVGGGLRAVVAVVATDGAVVAEVVGPDAAEVGVVSVGTTVDVIGDAVVVASDVARVAVLRVGELGLFELHPDETSAAASRAADAMRSTMTTSIELRRTECQHRTQPPMSKADSPRQRGWTLRGHRSAALRTSSRPRVTIVSQGRSGARTGCRQSPRQLTRVAGRPGDGPQLPPGVASVADELEQVGVERLLARTGVPCGASG